MTGIKKFICGCIYDFTKHEFVYKCDSYKRDIEKIK